MSGVARTLRLLAVSYWLHLKMIAVSAFDGVFQVIRQAPCRSRIMARQSW